MVHKVNPLQIPPDSIINLFHTFGFVKPEDTLHILRRRCHFLHCSTPGGKSQKLYVRGLIKNFGS